MHCADELLEAVSHELGVKPGETTPDGLVTFEFGECLGLCDFAPAALANETVYRNLSVETAKEFAGQLKAQAQKE